MIPTTWTVETARWSPEDVSNATYAALADWPAGQPAREQDLSLRISALYDVFVSPRDVRAELDALVETGHAETARVPRNGQPGKTRRAYLLARGTE